MDNHIKCLVVCASAIGVVPRNVITLPLVHHCYSYGFCLPPPHLSDWMVPV
jgi:hypothetical protein